MKWKSKVIEWGLILLLVIGFLFFREYAKRRSDNQYKRQVDKNGIISKGAVFSKDFSNKYHHNSLKFSYKYKRRYYINADIILFNELSIGDSVLIKIDTTKPEASYIISRLN